MSVGHGVSIAIWRENRGKWNREMVDPGMMCGAERPEDFMWQTGQAELRAGLGCKTRVYGVLGAC